MGEMNAHLDYIRLASFEFSAHQDATAELMLFTPGGWTFGSWLQYKGWKKESIFVGRGEQNKKRHGILQVSGRQSQEMLEFLLQHEKHYCTRMDIQMTIPMPAGVYLTKIHKNLGKKVSTLISSESNDTLYVGNRSSDIFTRLYEKVLDRKYLRLEFELKGQRSRAAWLALLAGASVGEIFKYYYEKSILPAGVKKHYDVSGIDDTDKAMRAEVVKEAQKKLAWIQSIDGAIMKAIFDHDIGEEVRHIVQTWAAVSCNVDKLRDED